MSEQWRSAVEQMQRAVDELAMDDQRRVYKLWQQRPGQQRRQGSEALARLRDMVRRLDED